MLKPYPKSNTKKPVKVVYIKRVKPNPMSGKKVKELAARNLLKIQLRKERGDWCEAKLPVCKGVWIDLHELMSRGQCGDPLDPENIICVCRRCHEWITTHPAESMRLGFRLTRQVQCATMNYNQALTARNQ